jgi:hypothetical protein
LRGSERVCFGACYRIGHAPRLFIRLELGRCHVPAASQRQQCDERAYPSQPTLGRPRRRRSAGSRHFQLDTDVPAMFRRAERVFGEPPVANALRSDPADRRSRLRPHATFETA